MSLDDLSAGERAYLDSRGQSAEQLVSENPQLPSGHTDDKGAFVETDRQAGESPLGEVQANEPQDTRPADQGGHEQAPTKRVSYNKYRESLDRIAQLEADNRAQAEERARLDERVRLINEALQEDQTQVVDDDPAPDPMEDAYAYMQWQTRQIGRMQAEAEQQRQHQQAVQEQQQLVNIYKHSMESAAQQHPVLGPAYQYLIQHRAHELALNRQDLSPEQRQLLLQQEELALAHREISAGRHPADLVYQLALSRGFGVQANGNGTVPTPASAPSYAGNGGAPTYTSPAPNSGPSAVQQVEAIQRGQRAAQSLSNAGGGTAVSGISARDLANMSEAEFQAVFNRLQGRNDKARLRELMGY